MFCFLYFIRFAIIKKVKINYKSMVGLFFNKKSNSNKKLSSQEVKRSLYRISGLDRSERETVVTALRAENDMGGITEFELKRTLRSLKRNHTISKGQARIIKKRLFG